MQIEHALHFIEIAVIHCVERHPFLRRVAEWPIGRREGVHHSLAIASVEQQNAPAQPCHILRQLIHCLVFGDCV